MTGNTGGSWKVAEGRDGKNVLMEVVDFRRTPPLPFPPDRSLLTFSLCWSFLEVSGSFCSCQTNAFTKLEIKFCWSSEPTTDPGCNPLKFNKGGCSLKKRGGFVAAGVTVRKPRTVESFQSFRFFELPPNAEIGICSVERP